MLIAINTLPDFSFAWPAGTNPAFVYILKAGFLGPLGPGNLGAGALSTIIAAGGPDWIFKYTFAAPDTDTKGDLAIFVSDNIATNLLVANHQVVTALPGDPGELTNAERDAVAAAILGLSNGVDVGVSLAHAQMATAAILAGKTSTAGNVTQFRNWADTKNRVTVTTSPSGRVTVVFDFS